jgi:hypothetical protein
MRLKIMITCCVGLFLLLTVAPAVSLATVPQQINYQGFLADSSGNPVSDGNYTMSFDIYNMSSGGDPLWSESQTVTVKDGVYNVILGQSGNPINPDIFDGDRYLGVTIGTDAEMTPRQKLTATAYAMKAAKADSVSDGAVTSVMLANGAVDADKVADNAITSAKIADSTITAADISGGAGSGLNADMLDGFSSESFLLAGSDFGRSGVTSSLYEGSTALSDKYVNETGDDMTGRLTATYTPFGAGFTEAIKGTLNGGSGAVAGVSGVSTNNDAGYGVYGGSTGSQGQGVHGVATGTNGIGVYGLATSENGWAGYFSGGLYASGNVGIGTTNPDSKLHVVGNSKFEIGGGSIAITTPGGWPGLIAYSQNGHRRDIQYYNDLMAITMSDSSDASPSDNGIRIYENGDVAVKVLQITGGSDLSERFDIHSLKAGLEPSPGMVVSIDPENLGDLIISHTAYDKRVAGIISGAGGVKPGMLMGQKGSKADGKNPVALSGRVYCWADASSGSIQPGDLLTTSDTPGHAMKVTDYAKGHGAIIGKAMTSLAAGKGLVLVLVALQ